MPLTEPVVDSFEELLAQSRQTEQDCASASTTTSNVLLNVRMVSGMMGAMLQGIAEVKNRVTESQERAAHATTQAHAALDRVAALSHAVEQIASTAGLVSRIAHETHMLALNATIEAARAGDAGKGFAVVASEVKVLSNQTAQATVDVNKHLASIRKVNTEVMGSVASVNENLAAIQQLVGGVTTAVTEQSNSLATVAAYAQEAADSVEGVAATLDRIAEIARLTAEKIRNSHRPD